MALFALAYSSHLLWYWPLRKTWYHHTSLSSAPLSQELLILPNSFLERESWSQLYQMFLIALQLDHAPQVFNSGLGMRLYEGRFGYLQGVVFMQNFWNFKVIPDTKIMLTSIQSKLILKRFKWFLWRGFQKWWKLFVLILVKKYEVTWRDIWLVIKGWDFNLRVIENRLSTKMWKTRSDIWLVTKGLNFNLRVIENRI